MIAIRVAVVIAIVIMSGCSSVDRSTGDRPSNGTISREAIFTAAEIAGLQFTAAEADSMIDGLLEQRKNYQHIREIRIDNAIQSALFFNPIPHSFIAERESRPFARLDTGAVEIPKNRDMIAFFTIGQLARLIETRQITSEELTRLYLDRLKKYGPTLECTISLTEEIALAQAQKADQEISHGLYKGPLHGIPYGLKDMFSTKQALTTWGSAIYKDRAIQIDATVYERLRNAGAVLVAKLSMGELAWGDVWFGGTTRNPWDMKSGSSGSSAGPAAATAAGLVAFAIGSETWGSIVSPSATCGVTGLRPTYGRVSRTGAMSLAPSMDKIGPICRSVEDCAIVLNAIKGPDYIDQTLTDVPFNYPASLPLYKFLVGYVKSEFDSMRQDKEIYDSTLAVMKRLGARLVPIKLPSRALNDLSIILSAEAGATFDELTRNGEDEKMVRQIKDAWPNVLRLSRFIPAVEYIQANRLRYLLVKDMEGVMNAVDVILVPSMSGDHSLLTNLTGHPCVAVPNGFDKDGKPTSICFIGRLYKEGDMLSIAKKYQDATGFHLKHPAFR